MRGQVWNIGPEKRKKAFFTRQAALGAEQDARRTAAMCVCASGGRSLLSVRFILLSPGVFVSMLRAQ